MPGSIRTIDATSQRYDPIEDPPSSPDQTFAVDRKKKDLLSQKFPPSPEDSDSGIAMREASPEGSPDATAREERRITRNIDWGTPGDHDISSESQTPQQRELARKKSQYYEKAFATRERSGSARERVTNESLVYADVRTNVIVSTVHMPFHRMLALLIFFRLKTNTLLSWISPTPSPHATNDQKPPLLSLYHTRFACSLEETSILHTP
jgi:hypothetical protein